MRVVGGIYKSRQILAPKGITIRITMDNVKEALFDIIGSVIVDTRCLDLFCGSGNLGIEAISRGSSFVTFVDIDSRCIRTTEENLNKLKVSRQSGIPPAAGKGLKFKVLKMDALKAIEYLAKGDEKFDIIFLDPPYYRNWVRKSLIKISDYDILYHSGIIAAEHFKKDNVPQETKNLSRFRQANYGDTVLSFYKFKEIQ